MRLPRLRSTFTALLLSDCGALFAALALAFALRAWGGGYLPIGEYFDILPFFLIFPLLYGALGMYPGVLQSPSKELKFLTIGTCLGFLCLSFFFFLEQQGTLFSRFVVLFAWLLALVLVPLFRFFTRRNCSRRPWWGYPVIWFAPPGDHSLPLRLFSAYRERGLFIARTVPLAPGVNAKEGASHGAKAKEEASSGVNAGKKDAATAGNGDNTPTAISDAELAALADAHPGALAFVLADALPPERLQALVLRLNGHFRRIIVRLDTSWLMQSSLSVAESPCGQVLTMRQNLLDPARMRMKRFLDLVFCCIGSPFFLLLIPLIGLIIRLDSKGPVFFVQQRVGQHGRPIRVLKFRTMVHNAPEVLANALKENPDLRAEWAGAQKLAKDPRLTRAGKWLRRTSLDELPQIINVLRGDMSMVGPRPIVEKEIARYGDAFDLYSRVKPGITGLWQVSGRNDLKYARRVQLDQFYVYNWSVWLDLYILIRTGPTVISGRGAY